MAIPLRVLILEDRADDAKLILHELRQAGYEPLARRVDNEVDFTAALDPALDLILADFGLPGWNGTEALGVVQRLGLDIPVIIVSGSIGEERAVAAMKAGASDYIMKDRLGRLGPAVERELRDARERHGRKQLEEKARLLLAELSDTQRVLLSVIEDQKKVEVERERLLVRAEASRRTLLSVVEDQRQSEAALQESEERFRRAILDSPFPIMLHAEDGSILQVSNSWCEVTGYTREELTTIGDWTERAYGERKALVQAEIDRLYGLAQRVSEGDFPIRTKFGDTRIWDFSSAPLGRLADGRRLVISMAMDVTERRAAETKVHEINAVLEARVRDRTAQLEAANQELEAFSYSVSHDLRAPLRAMDGFSQALLEDCAGQLDERGRNYLGRVRGAAARMGGLIEDLLHLARVTRAELRREQVDLSALAGTVVDELRQAQADRAVEVDIAAGLVGEGDARLLRVVLTNLLGNAWKFTGRQPHARIEFGVTSGERRVASSEQGDPGARPTAPVTYFVRDNGAGFDMAYAEKLFGAFQRLHAAAEFPGTGIGLASVQRIIHRHGGRVWAESAVGQGATFYFTLEALAVQGGPCAPRAAETETAGLSHETQMHSETPRAERTAHLSIPPSRSELRAIGPNENAAAKPPNP